MPKGKPTAGTRRPGAGRKKKDGAKVAVAFRLPADLVERLRKEPNQSALVENLLRGWFDADDIEIEPE